MATKVAILTQLANIKVVGNMGVKDTDVCNQNKETRVSPEL
jgi:hypothetical protein